MEIRSAKQVLAGRFNSNPELMDENAHCRVSSALRAMEEYADQFKDEITRLNEVKANDVSFHYATIESEMKEDLISKISDLIYHAIPTGEIEAFTLIKILKKLKTDIESL